MIYFGSTQKAVPYTQYQTYALTTGANSLWIQGSTSWTQYAMVPQGSMLNHDHHLANRWQTAIFTRFILTAHWTRTATTSIPTIR